MSYVCKQVKIKKYDITKASCLLQVGMQIPILMAIIEYGIILGMKKQDTKRLNLRKISITKIAVYDFEKILDKWTSYGLFVYIIIFNCVYWTAAERSKMTE